MLLFALLTTLIQAGETPSFLGLTPGVTSRAAIDLQLEYIGVLPDENAHEYHPPPQVTDVARVIISYFEDTAIMARLDVHIKQPLAVEGLRSRFGHLLLSRSRQDGGNEEIYYPAMQALVFYGDDTMAPVSSLSRVSAISYLSPRYLADINLDRFNELKKKGAIADAKLEADKAILIAPDYARGYLGLGIYFEQMKNFDSALDAYRTAAKSGDGLASKARAMAYLGTLTSRYKKDDKAAEAIFKQGLQIWSLDAEINQNYGWFLWLKKRDKEAIPLLYKAFELDIYHAQQWLKSANNHYNKKNYQHAADFYQLLTAWFDKNNATQAEPKLRADTNRFYSYSLAQLKKYPEAINQNRKTLTLLPDDFIMLRELGFNLMVTGQYPEALNKLQKAQAMFPKNPWMMVMMARIHASMGQQKKAFQWLAAAIKAGYKNKSFLEQDEFLASIRGKRQFNKLIKTL